MSTVDQIAAQYLGAAPAASASPNEAVAAQAAQTAAAQQQKAEATAEAVKTAEATVDASRPAENPEETAAYEIDFDGEKRKLSPGQIKGTFERYKALNAKHGNMKPVLALAEKLMEGTGANAEQVAMAMMAAMKNATKNPAMGAAAQRGETPQEPDEDAALEAWERDNAASLPPGYKDMAKGNKSVMAELKRTQAMLVQVLQGSKQVADAAAQQGQQVQQRAVAQAKQQMAINLSKAQQHHGLPDEAAQDFMTFAAERGYTLEDFVNPDLAYAVVGDFKNAKDSPEMERLRAIAQKRQAFTPSVGSAPAGGNGTGAAPTPFDKLADVAIARRNR